MTLTDTSAGTMTVAELYAAWNKLRTRLTRERKEGRYVQDYAAVVEVQMRGALHLHVLMTGRYIAQRKLVGMAKAAGFGRCTDIREVKRSKPDGEKGSAVYATKQLAGYLTKEAANALGGKTNVRRRPLRTSRGWADGISLSKAEKLIAADRREAIAAETGEETDTGPFAFVQVFANGSMFVRVGGQTDVHLALVADAAAPEAATDGERAEPPGGASEPDRAAARSAQRTVQLVIEGLAA
jgi:hypothetical protein